MKHSKLVLTLIALLALSACGQKQEAPQQATTESAAPAVVQETPAAPAADTMVSSNATPDVGKIKFGSVCAGCHGIKGQGQASFPKLAGQTAEEITAKLMDYKAGKKRGEQTAIMTPTAQGLSDDDIKALAGYIASLGG